MTSNPQTLFARKLRHTQTPAEARLWEALRAGRFDGHRFRRQHLIGRYIADFACERLMLVIELDGGVHDQDDRALNDHLRQQDIEALGWFVLRFSNEMVMGRLLEVLEAIREQIRLARP
ncbi:MAG: DUF559 domain-containing protein [Brevundimonas sp.]|uniref:endonuclease domain-containing protein n=1 Tax=Brevundimonas sp. TaxID=1871086 RepID=UPI0025BBD5B7|nr:endonuclease domain-containing protein [Brevundimonas sp.]MBX3478524.1 DUF559 domain-containing protein [Brevundimonas sp.]